MVRASVCPAILDREIAALAPAELAQPPNESVDHLALHRGGVAAQESNGGMFAALLRARHERPSRRCAAERDYEFSPSNVDCHETLP
jgi:hypothetical protein